MPEQLLNFPQETINPSAQEIDTRRIKDAELVGASLVEESVVINPIHEASDKLEVLRPMNGLDIRISDEEVRSEVAQEITDFRDFLAGDTAAGSRISPEHPAQDAGDAVGLLSDLAVLHINEDDLARIESSLEAAGKTSQEVDTTVHGALERMAKVIDHSMKSDEVFGHSIYKSVPGLFEKILKSGALKNKRGVAEEHGRIEGLSSGGHSQMIHMRQEPVGDTFYFGAGALIEAAPYISAGVDDYIGGSEGVVSGARNRIRGKDEAHAGPGGVKHAFTGVEIEISDELKAALPSVEDRELRTDVSFMASTETPEAAAAYEFPLEDATIILRSPSIELDTAPDNREAKLVQSLDDNQQAYKATMAALAKSANLTGIPDFEASGIGAEDRLVWDRMIKDTVAVQEQYNEFGKLSGRTEMIRGAMATALAREKARLDGVKDEIAQNIFVIESGNMNSLDPIGRDFAKFRESKKNPPTRQFVDYKSDVLKFSQDELADQGIGS